MRLIVLDSGSAANGYILESSTGECLIIDAGCPIKEGMKPIMFEIERVSGLIVSHRHGDHANFIGEYIEYGISTFVNTDTIENKGLRKHHNVTEIFSERQFAVGSFQVKPLEVSHGVQCFSFLISHPEMGICYFITDSNYCQWDLRGAGITNWMVECNYHREKLDENFEKGYIPKNVFDHVLTGHFGLEHCQEFFRTNDLSKTNKIVLLHSSSKNGNRKFFKEEIEKVCGKKVEVAKKGLVVENFNRRPF